MEHYNFVLSLISRLKSALEILKQHAFWYFLDSQKVHGLKEFKTNVPLTILVAKI